MQDARYRMQDTRCRIQDVKYPASCFLYPLSYIGFSEEQQEQLMEFIPFVVFPYFSVSPCLRG